MEDRNFDYNPGKDVMAKLDGGPKQDFNDGMLARLSRFDNSRAAKAITIICWIGMVGVAIAAINLMFGQPWF